MVRFALSLVAKLPGDLQPVALTSFRRARRGGRASAHVGRFGLIVAKCARYRWNTSHAGPMWEVGESLAPC
jgi:hypothetical protein